MTLNIEELQALETKFELTAGNLAAEDLGVETKTGTDSDDVLLGSVDSETIVGLSGNDSMFGKSGGDTLVGGEGEDEILSNGGSALLVGNEGNDVLRALAITDTADGNSTLIGGQGEDFLSGGKGEDLLLGGSEADTIFSSDGNDTLIGGDGSDLLSGDGGNDAVIGGKGNDTVYGADGDDTVYGGEGDDTLYDTQGSDILTGEEGSDKFVLLPGTDTDTISDFQDGQDRFTLINDTPQLGLTFEQLEITESGENTAISIADTGEVLVELTGVSADAVTADDFDNLTFAEFSETPTEAEIDSSESSDTADSQAEQLDSNADIGAVTSQGVEAMNVDEARSRSDVDGEGVTVGVISDSFDRNLSAETSANDDVLSGDLPGEDNPNGYNTPVRVLDDPTIDPLATFDRDEGRAMLQIIHDVAPGAELVFHQGGGNEQELAGAVDNLADAGADIIVDDVGFADSQSFLQDDIVSQAVDDAVAEGVAYFSAAGNEGNSSYESEFRPVEPDAQPPIPELEREYVLHDFNPEAEVDVFQGVTLEPSQGVNFTLQWDEPSASAGEKGAANDLDVFLLDSESNIVAASTESNVGQIPSEFSGYTNETDNTEEYNLVIAQDIAAGGATPGFIKYIGGGFDSENTEYFTGSSTIYGQRNAVGTEAVGEADYRQTPAFGTDPAELFPSSSTGNTPILFDSEGNRLPEPEIRNKPSIVAPAGGNTTFFGSADTDEDGFPNFGGTSAAAPHAAGVAALLLEANPEASPERVYQALEQSALDMDNPYTQGSDPGYDPATGYGLIQADLALEELLGTSDPGLANLSSEDASV